MFILPGVSLLLMCALFIFSYITTKKDEVEFQKNQFRTQGIVFGKTINVGGNYRKLHLHFMDRDFREWRWTSEPFNSLKNEFQKDSVVQIVFAERKTLFGNKPEVRVIDRRYVKKKKINDLYIALGLAIICGIASIAMFILQVLQVVL